MVQKIDWQTIGIHIDKETKHPFTIKKIIPVSGGCINSAYQLLGKDKSFFIKINKYALIDMFIAEYTGLKEISKYKTIKVPQPITYGTCEDISYLVIEMLTLQATTQISDQQLAQQLAALHKIKQPFFGWHHHNTIGSTSQLNTPSKDWMSFWCANRLGFQLSLAKKNGYKGSLINSGEKLSELIPCFFNSYQPQAALLHGDLWSGNTAITQQGEPVIYDPACYYGDREADIAMTELFGGFSADFYATYQQHYPLDSGYATRKTLYNLYHILNHLNIFGSSYQTQAQNMLDYLLSEVL